MKSLRSMAIMLGMSALGVLYLPALGTAYTQADLVGTWALNNLASGPGAPWWYRGAITFAANGSFTGTGHESDGNTESLSGAFNINPDGVMTGPSFPNLSCNMDAGKTVISCTNTWNGSYVQKSCMEQDPYSVRFAHVR